MAYLDALTRVGVGGPSRQYVGFAAQASASVSATLLESTIRAGGETITITLTADTWVTAGATFDAERQAILDGIDGTFIASQSVSTVVRTSDTVVTITLEAVSDYTISADEVVSVTVPGTAVDGGNALSAGSFTVTDDVQDVVAEILMVAANSRSVIVLERTDTHIIIAESNDEDILINEH